MNPYEVTLRELNFDKNLYEYYPDHPTRDQIECMRLYNSKKLEDYTAKDLTVMLRNEIEPETLVELALDYISENLFYKADAYAGDLLSALCAQNLTYWKEFSEQKEILVQQMKIYEERLNLAKYQLNLIDDETWQRKKGEFNN